MSRAVCACGRFVADVEATVATFGGEPEYIKTVEGTCKVHGRTEAFLAYDGELHGWAWEDFFGAEGAA